jgi:glutamyl-tRNA synthetase
MTVRTRFAPSPTGYLHIGGARTALFNWLYARNQGGKFILRIEDTDRERSTPEAVNAIFDGLTWLGLTWDEGPDHALATCHLPLATSTHGPYFQSQRLDIFKKHYTHLLDKGVAFEKDGAVYIKGDPEKKIEDFVIVKSDGFPVYNFAVVVDDATMEITHVIRGDDHISNTPRQILIYKALGLPIPKIIHVPMILGSDGERLSKRHGATSVTEFRGLGFLPEAMVNYLARLGWAHGDQEFFTVDDLIQKFSLSKLGKSPAVFDPHKLDWVNSEHIKHAQAERLREFLPANYLKEPRLNVIIDLVKSRAKTLHGLVSAVGIFLNDNIVIEPAAGDLLDPNKKRSLQELAEALQKVNSWTRKDIETVVRDFAEKRGLAAGDLIHPLRAALTGTTVSPGIFEVMELLTKEKTMLRLGQLNTAI